MKTPSIRRSLVPLGALLACFTLLACPADANPESKRRGGGAAGKSRDSKSLRERLTPLQYRVTQEDGTEPPFENAYWDNERPGLYVDVVSGEPLFLSLDKFKSGTGWPSFTRPIAEGAVVEKVDRSMGVARTEIRSARADSHLGHVFKDGPKPTGLRYCMNSAAMRFVPLERMAQEGYAEHLNRFGEKYEVATFGGGCFWCMEKPFDELEGVLATTSGYMGGPSENPTYEQVSSGKTRHAEVVQVLFDPEKISYAALVDRFWRNVDPFAEDRQFCDRGAQYRSAIFTHDPIQKRVASKSKKRVGLKLGADEPVATEVTEAGAFWPAEAYHQDFYRTTPGRYESYRKGCRRDARLEEIWGDEAGGRKVR